MSLGPIPEGAAPMGLTLIEAATGCVEPAETRLEHLAVIKTFAESELLSRLPFMNIPGGGLFKSVEIEAPLGGLPSGERGLQAELQRQWRP